MDSSKDSKFPELLFPRFYHTGPPKGKATCPVKGWGLYGGVNAVQGPEKSSWSFHAQRAAKGHMWVPVEPIPTPLLPPNKGSGKYFHCHVANALDFPDHMQNFFLDYPQIAFGTMSGLLGEHFSFGQANKNGKAADLSCMNTFLADVTRKRCPMIYFSKRAKLYSRLLGDVIQDIPPALLGECLHEELLLLGKRQQLCELATGGALGYFPLTGSKGCLVYPRGSTLNSLNFRKTLLKNQKGESPQLVFTKKPIVFKLSGTVRQISISPMEERARIAVRSDYHCGVWLASHAHKPSVVEVIQTEHVATCVNASPHIPTEFVVACESGAAYLWTVGKGLSKFYQEEGNLYFNARSSWRWCEFTSHPRVMAFADRTGMNLTDVRTDPNCSRTLFRIGEPADCKSGERVTLCKHLYNINSHHHLVTTQYSAYIMDERFPGLPMVKWEHMMDAPPLFAQAIVGSQTAVDNAVLLGSRSPPDVVLFHYSGGDVVACHSTGPPRKLSSPKKSLKYLAPRIPHRQEKVQQRLEAPSAGLASIHCSKKAKCLCVLQLSDAGDIFYHMLQPDSAQNDQLQSLRVSSTSADAEPSNAKTNQESSRDKGQESTLDMTPCADIEGNGSIPSKASNKTLLKWNKWVRNAFSRTKTKSSSKFRWSVKTKGLVYLQDERSRSTKKCLERINRNMKDIMRTKTLITHGATSLPPPAIVPLPNPPEPLDLGDDLSQRLSISWQGQWKSWWEEKLGLNRDQKIEMLRKKRRREKRARAHNRFNFSGSFTSTVSYQSELDSLSCSYETSSLGDCQFVDSERSMDGSQWGVEAAPGLVASPETESQRSQRSRLTRNPRVSTGKPALENQGDLLETRTRKRPFQDSFGSFGSQSEPQGHMEGYDFFPLATSSQMSSISVSQREPSVVQASQSSLSLPRKKKSRMGF